MPIDYQATAQRTKARWAEHKTKFGYCVVNPDDKPWTPEEDKLLGTESDEVIAKKLGRTFIAVSYRRQQKHIPTAGKQYRAWTGEEEKLLGTDTDTAIALHLHRSAIDVRWRRETLGVKAFAEDGATPWIEFELRLL